MTLFEQQLHCALTSYDFKISTVTLVNNKICFPEITHNPLSQNFEIENGTHGNKTREEKISCYQYLSVGESSRLRG